MNMHRYDSLPSEPDGPRRRHGMAPVTVASEVAWTQVAIVILLVLIFLALCAITVLLSVFLHVALRNEGPFHNLVDALGEIGGISSRAGPIVDVLSRGAEGVTFNATSVMENALPKEQVEVEAFMRALFSNTNGALGLMSAAYDKDLVGRVGYAMDHPAMGSAAAVVDWISNRTADGSVDSGASFVKSTIQFGMNFTQEESQAFDAIEKVTTSIAPLVGNVNDLIATLNEVQESIFFSEMSRRFYVIFDQLTEGKRGAQLAENTNEIYAGLTSIVRYAASEELHARVNSILAMFPEVADVAVKIGEKFRSGGLGVRLGDDPK